MADLNDFNANDVDPSFAFEPIPAGEYVAAITASDMKATKAGTGSYLELVFQVLEDEYKGRLLWLRLNLDNPNAQAVQIARAKLSALCRATGVMTPQDSNELHDLPHMITVKCKRRDDTGEIANEICGFAKLDTTPVTAPAGDTPPWKRG